MIFRIITPCLYPSHAIICKVPQSSSEFQTQIQPQWTGRFSMSRKEGHLLVDGYKKKADIEYPFEDGEVINYTLDGVSIYSVTTNINPSCITHLPERKETTQGFHHETNSDFIKTVTKFNGCDRRKLRN